jgi:glycerol-3-phosphate dehydrogenase
VKRDLGAMAGRSHDLAIVGGGIYGVCAAWEAARRGLSVCLLERGDFGGATSSQSLKVVHGGLRYLQHADLRRFREGVAERRSFLELAPHLVDPLPFVIPTYGRGLRSREAMALALLVNDVLSVGRSPRGDPSKRIPRGRVLRRGAVLDLLPGLAGTGLTGGALWYDCQTWSTERLLLAFLTAAAEAGAAVANQAEVIGFLGTPGRVEGVRVRDAEAGGLHEVRARVVLNAAGPWVDAVLGRLASRPSTPRFHLSKAFNLVTRRLLDRAVGLEGSAEFRDRDALIDKGSRLFFVVPWQDLTLLGTRHLPWRGDPDEFRITPQDVQLFLGEVNAAYPAFALRPDDVLGVYGGMLPQSPASKGASEVELEKKAQLVDHAREDGVDGLVTMVGVKWTAARAVAARAVALAVRKLGRAAPEPRDARPRLPGSQFERHDAWLQRARAAKSPLLQDASNEHLLRSFGTRIDVLLRLIGERAELAAPVQEGSPVIGAEIVNAVRHEMALHLDDVLLRRTQLAFARPLGDDAVERVARLMAKEAGWDAARIDRELARGQAALARFRGR